LGDVTGDSGTRAPSVPPLACSSKSRDKGKQNPLSSRRIFGIGIETFQIHPGIFRLFCLSIGVRLLAITSWRCSWRASSFTRARQGGEERSANLVGEKRHFQEALERAIAFLQLRKVAAPKTVV
jgi:hypothetical protein